MTEKKLNSPYSNHTLMALSELVRETRRVCFAMERLESPAVIAARLKRLRPFCAALMQELTMDKTDARRRALSSAWHTMFGGLSANMRAILFIAASAAAAFAIVYLGEVSS